MSFMTHCCPLYVSFTKHAHNTLCSIKVNSADDKTGTNNTWVCKIFDIRADTEMKRVWFYIAWYYSTNDIIRYIAGRYSENDDGSPTTPINVYHQYLVDHLPAQTTSFDRFLSNHTELLLANVTQGEVLHTIFSVRN